MGGAIAVWVAIRQMNIARLRHEKQTEADFQRRIIESFSRATEQLGNDKIEVRLGGIYTLERISRESPDDYWTVMETLCALFESGHDGERRMQLHLELLTPTATRRRLQSIGFDSQRILLPC